MQCYEQASHRTVILQEPRSQCLYKTLPETFHLQCPLIAYNFQPLKPKKREFSMLIICQRLFLSNVSARTSYPLSKISTLRYFIMGKLEF